MKLTKPLILILIGILLITVAAAYTAYTLIIQSVGDINTPVSITALPSSIDWGTLDAEQIVDRYITLTNNGDTATQPLTVSASPTVGTLTNNATSATIPAHSSITIDFRLTVSANPPTGPFTFDITIVG